MGFRSVSGLASRRAWRKEQGRRWWARFSRRIRASIHRAREKFWPRVGFALTHTLIVRNDQGHQQFSAGRVAGAFSSGFSGMAWTPDPLNSTSAAMVRVGTSMGGVVAGSFWKEFQPDIYEPGIEHLSQTAEGGNQAAQKDRGHQMKTVSIPVVLLIALAGCVPQKQWRQKPFYAATLADRSKDVEQRYVSPQDVHGRRLYSFAFVGFKNNGDFWDKRQLDEALHAIDDADRRSGHRAVVVTFIHGWKNNARQDNNNVLDFRRQLNRIAADACKGRPGALRSRGRVSGLERRPGQ